ncbi:MAG: hypothetical protein AAF985_16490 [Bacteroidota bacterium]
MISIQAFEPITTELDKQFIAFLALAIGLSIALWWYNRKKLEYPKRKQQQMITLVGFFIIMIALGSAFFSWLTTKKIKTVNISEEAIITPYGTAEIDNIREAYIYFDKQSSRFSNEMVLDTTRFLIIEEYGRAKKTHALSEDHYDIDEIRKILLEKIKELKE